MNQPVIRVGYAPSNEPDGNAIKGDFLCQLANLLNSLKSLISHKVDTDINESINLMRRSRSMQTKYYGI
jgi:hypothetical protein